MILKSYGLNFGANIGKSFVNSYTSLDCPVPYNHRFHCQLRNLEVNTLELKSAVSQGKYKHKQIWPQLEGLHLRRLML